MIPKSAASVITQPAVDLIGAEPVAKSRARQNWVLNPLQDALLIIIAPVITLALALMAIRFWGATDGATIVLLVHVVFTVAHHLPTFIRIYGDVELFKRFRWSFIFAPLIAFGFAFAVTAYLNIKGYPLERFLFLYIILTVWDPWHFMRQHYGFMRIYDRHNAAPRKTTARLDLALAASWFAYIMLASGDWLLDLLQDLYVRVQWPLLLAVTSNGLSLATMALRNVALLVSGIYLSYLLWCWAKGYFVSLAKVLLCVVTFGVMYLTYTPNALMQSLAPGWSFRVGFAVIGVVHMTQYLAIVWRYNRGLAARPGRARAGVFRWLHSRGMWWAAGGYVLLCLLYGELITTVRQNEWLMGVLLALGFTSTMMHYYFDGFIWKVRHQQNQEALGTDPAIRAIQNGVQHEVLSGRREALVASGAEPCLVLPQEQHAYSSYKSMSAPFQRTQAANDDTAQLTESELSDSSIPSTLALFAGRERTVSWWTSAKRTAAWFVFVRQLLYFGVPMSMLAAAAFMVSNGPRQQYSSGSYIDHMYQAQALNAQGLGDLAEREARAAFAAMQAELPLARKRTELQPTASREAELAFLIYNESLYENIVMPALDGRPAQDAQQSAHRQQVREAVALLSQAVGRGGSLAHAGRAQFTAADAGRILASWRKQVG